MSAGFRGPKACAWTPKDAVGHNYYVHTVVLYTEASHPSKPIKTETEKSRLSLSLPPSLPLSISISPSLHLSIAPSPSFHHSIILSYFIIPSFYNISIRSSHHSIIPSKQIHHRIARTRGKRLIRTDLVMNNKSVARHFMLRTV